MGVDGANTSTQPADNTSDNYLSVNSQGEVLVNKKMVFRFVMAVSVVVSFVFGYFPASAQPSFVNTPQIVSISPSSGAQVGARVEVHAKVDGSSDFRAMRICFRDHDWCQESGELDFSRTFDTGALSPGTYKIMVEVAAQGDNSWSNPARTETTYQLTGSSQPEPTSPPSNPSGPAITKFSFDPSGGTQVGNNVTIHIAVDSSNPGAIRTYVPCGGIGHFEHTVPSFDNQWSTSGCDTGDVTVKICARAVGDNDWAYATCKKKSYTLYAPPTKVPDAPTAKFWVDSENIQQGQCTTLYWETSHASKVDIDGKSVDKDGSMKVCPKVTTHYSLKAQGAGGEQTRSLSVVVNALPPTSAPVPTNSTPSVASSFRNGDLVKIGYDVFVIFNGQRRHVPNPDTLDALGVSQNEVNNKGFSESELGTIPRGSDIPDVNRDYSGFIAFKNQVFPNTQPIVPENDAEPQSSPPAQQQSSAPSNQGNSGEENASGSGTIQKGEENSQSDFVPLCSTETNEAPGGVITWFFNLISKEVQAREPFSDVTQCVAYVSVRRPDSLNWLQYGADAYKWDDMARQYGGAYGVTVTSYPNQGEGDIAVWERGCDGRSSTSGHVAYVTSTSNDGKSITVDERNVDNDGQIQRGNTYSVLPCMSFIHKPGSSQEQSPPLPTVNPQSNGSGTSSSWIDQLIGWIRNKLGISR